LGTFPSINAEEKKDLCSGKKKIATFGKALNHCYSGVLRFDAKRKQSFPWRSEPIFEYLRMILGQRWTECGDSLVWPRWASEKKEEQIDGPGGGGGEENNFEE